MGKPVTSCDNCRRSRLGCNAASQPKQPCFNCARRGVKCTTRPGVAGSRVQAKALSMKKPDIVSGTDSQYLLVEPPVSVTEMLDDCGMILIDSQSLRRPSSESLQATPPLASSDSLARSQQALTLHNLLWNIFTTLLEPRIGLWIGGGGCPFISSSTVRDSILVLYTQTLTVTVIDYLDFQTGDPLGQESSKCERTSKRPAFPVEHYRQQ